MFYIRCKAALSGLQTAAAILPDGEQHKRLEVASQIWDVALSKPMSRDCTFLALGGGVIGDMTGFAAAAYQRGVDFIQVCLSVPILSWRYSRSLGGFGKAVDGT